MENECEALPGVAYPGVRDNRSTLNTKTGYDEYHWLVPDNSYLRDFKSLLVASHGNGTMASVRPSP